MPKQMDTNGCVWICGCVQMGVRREQKSLIKKTWPMIIKLMKRRGQWFDGSCHQCNMNWALIAATAAKQLTTVWPDIAWLGIIIFYVHINNNKANSVLNFPSHILVHVVIAGLPFGQFSFNPSSVWN